MGPPAAGPSFWIARLRSRLVEPEGVEPDDVVNAEIVLWIVALYVVVPDVVDLLPGDRQYRRGLFHDGLGLTHQILSLLRIELAVNLVDQRVELLVVPEAVILRSAGLVPSIEVVRRVEQGRDD